MGGKLQVHKLIQKEKDYSDWSKQAIGLKMPWIEEQLLTFPGEAKSLWLMQEVTEEPWTTLKDLQASLASAKVIVNDSTKLFSFTSFHTLCLYAALHLIINYQ